LFVLPTAILPGSGAKAAFAGNGGDKGAGNGGDRGGGRDHDRGDRGGSDDRGQGHGGAEPGRDRQDAHRDARSAFADARHRYDAALGRKESAEVDGAASRGRREAAAVLDPAQSGALVERGWTAGIAPTGTFRNHGQRVSTMVALAKELGYPASVGALQGNFGTPFENGLAGTAADLEAARAAAAASPGDAALQAEVARLEAELAAATADLPEGSAAGWAVLDLDVTDDGTVDAADLAAAMAGGTDEEASAGSSAP
jgi:hypothetical protein